MAGERIRVLIVDDDPEDAELLEELLHEAREIDPHVLFAESYEEGLDLLWAGEADVCLVDYRLGTRSGIEFIREPAIRAARVPTILMTGVGTREIDQEALEAGASDYLPKGDLTADRLDRSIRYAIEQRRRRRVESRMDALVGNARELVSILAPDGSLRYVSPSVRRVLGFEPDEKLEGDAMLEVHPDDREMVEEALRLVITGETARADLQYRVRHTDGSWRMLDTIAESRLDDPDIEGVVVSSWDVTERVRAQESTRFQATLLDAVGEAVVATDLCGEVVYWNRAAEELYGWSCEEAVGMDIVALTPTEKGRARATEIMEGLQEGNSWRGEFEVRRKDGTTFLALVSNSLVTDASGVVVGILGISSDITSLKETELALRERIKELRTLNRVGGLLNREDLSIDDRVQRVVACLPDGWLEPDHTEARLVLGRWSAQTAGFRETPWMQSAAIEANDQTGRLEIARTVGPEDGAAPFLPEESELLGGVASMIAQAIGRASLRRLLTEAFASLQEAVFVVEGDRVIRYANRAAEKIFGYAVDDLIGTSTERLHVDRAAFERFFAEGVEALERDGVVFASFDMRRKDGRVFHAEQTVTLLDRGRGLDGGVVSVVRDVSDRRRAEEELRASEERFRRIAEHIEDVFWMTAPDKSGMEYVSPAYEEIWDRSVEELYSDPDAWMEAVVPADREQVRRFAATQAEAPRTQEYRIQRPDGEIRHILDRSFPVRGEDGSVERVLGVARDVTEERRLEERFGILSGEITDVIYVLSAEGTVTSSSPSIAAATGYAREEFEGMDALDLVHPDDRERVREGLERVVSQPDHVARAEYRVVTKEGNVIQVDTVARNLLGDPAVGGILVTSRDVTERLELERRVRQMQKMESIGRLAGGVAHDFNNILTVIRSQADLILMDAPEGPVADDVTVIQDAADRAARLTRQLLAFSRDQVLQPRRTDLGQIVQETSDLIRRLIGEQVRVRYRVPRLRPAVRVDPHQLEQVLVNLSVNARDAMPEGGDLTISVYEESVDADRAERLPDLAAGEYVVVEVSDTGTGMTPEVQQKIFEPFFTTKPKGQGTGLGLSMVYGTVHQSGGSVQVESAPGEGTSFYLFFPVMEEAVEEGDETGASDRGSQARAATGTGTILLVEDDPQVRRAATRVLESAGLEVLQTGSAEEGLRLLGELVGDRGADDGRRIDAVVTDLTLPGMSGHEMLGHIRERWPRLPVVVMSGYTEDSPGRREGLPSDVPFVEKPFTPAGLINTVREVL